MKKCTNCKVNNSDRAKFCRKCGKPLAQASSPFTKKIKNKQTIMAGAALALAISGGIGFALYVNTPERKYQKNIDMAEKYLEEHNFVKAVEYLNVAKSIDPKKEEAYENLFKVYKAQGEIAKADEVIYEAQETLPSIQQSSFLSQLDSLTEKANEISTALEDSESKYTSIANDPSAQNTSSSSSSSQTQEQDISSTTSINKEVEKERSERPSVNSEDSIDQDPTSGTQKVSLDSKSKEEETVSVGPSSRSTEKEDSQSQTLSTSETEQIKPLPNTPYTVISDIGSLNMAPIALNSDCWVIKKGNEFQLLFPDGTTKKTEGEDQLVLQVNPQSSGSQALLSSACLMDGKSNNQYYPQDEEVSSCLSDTNEKSSYSLEGNYPSSTAPIVVRSNNQSGYWIYNPAHKALYGPFKDSEDTSFYSKMSHLSDITLIGHNGQIGGPYWTTTNPVASSKDEENPTLTTASKEATQANSSEKNKEESVNEELRIWSKDGKSYKTGYTNPKAVDWYTLGVMQGSQFHLLNENLEVVYVGPFDQGGSVIKSVAPVQINGTWKLVRFDNNILSSGPTTNYSFANEEKEESETSSNLSSTSSSQTKKSTDNSSTLNTQSKEKSSSSTITSESSKKESSKSKTSSTTSSSQSSKKESSNLSLKNEDSSVTSTAKTGNNSTKEGDKLEGSSIPKEKNENSSVTPSTGKKETSSKTIPNTTKEKSITPSNKTNSSINNDNEPAAPVYYSFSEFAGTYTVTGSDWSNSFILHTDGSFEGKYIEISEIGDPELYPNGVVSTCSYSGTFSLKNDRLKITSLSLEEAPGEIEIKNGILYEAIGLSGSCMSNGDMFTLYGPETPYSEFSSKALRWIPTPTTKTTMDFIMVQDGSLEYAYV